MEQGSKKVSANFEAKMKVVSEIEELFKSSKSMVAVDYRGITVAEDTDLRAKFREGGVAYKVYKNNLIKRALNNLGITDADEYFKGTLAFAFSQNDETAGAKIVKGAKFQNKMGFKFGLIGTNVLDANAVSTLATMPSKEVIIGQLLGLISSGARNLASTINAVPRNLACVLDARAKQLA